MLKDVDISDEFSADEETSENVEEKEVLQIAIINCPVNEDDDDSSVC